MNEINECRCGVYKILNIVNKKFYIGSSSNFQRRKSSHFSSLSKNKHPNKHLQAAYNKYGENNFVFIIIEHVDDRSILTEREQYWIDKLDACNKVVGYNMCATAGNYFGFKHSEEAKHKIGLANVGKKLSDEQKSKISKSNIGKHNFKHTEESKMKIKESSIARKCIPPSFKGKKWSKSAIEKVSIHVINLDTGKKFISVSEAARYYNTHTSSICAVCKNKRKTAGGYRWAKINKESDND